MAMDLSVCQPDHPAGGDRYLSELAPLLGRSPAMRAVRRMVEQVADTTAPVLILGESGTGKELVARALHHASTRRRGPFVKVNCAALPGELLESELFGHERGAFTGAEARKPGQFELAEGGTLFLDELGELPAPLQAKLLHVLQDGEFWRVGGSEPVWADARVVAATNRRLEADLASGRFREDLYYRLAVVEIRVPPLRERREEIPFLIEHFLARFQAQYERRVTLPADLGARLVALDWPGNVRELENVIRRLVVLGVESVRAEFMGQPFQAEPHMSPGADAGPPPGLGLLEIARQASREAEGRAIRQVLERVRWNRAAAARALGISYKTLLGRIAACALEEPRRNGMANRTTRGHVPGSRKN